MNYQLANDYLVVTVKAEGAEVTSVKSREGLEYIWCGDRKYWARHAPVLFPIIGKVLDNTYTVHDKTYHLTQHGFARDEVFKLVKQTEKMLVFKLEASEKTKERYPFEFSLSITYSLEANRLKVGYEVVNKGKETMPFTIGAHPAFNCPMVEGECLEEYYIEFEKEEEATRLIVTPEVYLSGETTSYVVKAIDLTASFFSEDAVMLTNLKSSYLALKGRRHKHSVTLHSKDFPFLGIWSPVEGAPFVCLEPWMGHTDYVTNDKELAKKRDFIQLGAEEQFNAAYELAFN